MRVEATTNEHKAALRLLGALPPLRGAVVTADATFPHADGGQALLAREGEYVRYAKGNRATRRNDVAARFTAASRGDFPPGDAGRVAGRRTHPLDRGPGPRPTGAADDPDHDVAQRVLGGLATSGPGVSAGAGANGEG